MVVVEMGVGETGVGEMGIPDSNILMDFKNPTPNQIILKL